jgi:CubicO group peptidase (beta-lactamase class C family)
MQTAGRLATAALLAIACCLSDAQAPTFPTLPTAPAQPVATSANGPVPANPATGHELTGADLESFFDGIFPMQLERNDVAGASVLVMKDGNILLQKGYGYADLKTKRPVDPSATIFRLASISKLFTWISVMQLEEQGKLDIDADVNRYLDFPIAPAFNKPVTLRNLMTHTGGFEEVLNDLIVLDPRKSPSLRDDLIANQPKRIYPPGAIPAYSNYGVGLASYIVQRVSGERFEQYVEEHIFVPLGMTHSAFYQPLSPELSKTVSEGYKESTEKPPLGFEMVEPVGAGALSSSAADMGRFGQALLNGGELDGQRILKPETLAMMWTPQFRATDQLPAICMGFYQSWRNDLRWIGHEGDLIAFHSLFFVEPAQKLVIFASFNSAGGGDQPRPEIINMFSDRYFPAAQKSAFLKTPGNELKAIEGMYQSTRRAESTRLKLSNLGHQQRATVDKDGVLRIAGFKDLRGHVIQWKPIGTDLWQESDGQERLFAIRDGNHRVVRLALDFPGVQLQRVAWYEDQRLVLSGFSVSLTILSLVVLASLIRTGRRLFMRRRPRQQPQPGTIWLTLGPRLAAFAWVVVQLLVLTWQLSTRDVPFPYNPDLFRWLALLNWAVGGAMFLSIFAVIAGIRIWWRPDTRRITRIKFSLVSLACLFACWFAVYWRLIGPAQRI